MFSPFKHIENPLKLGLLVVENLILLLFDIIYQQVLRIYSSYLQLFLYISGSRSSASDFDDSAVFARENSLSRFLIGQCHLNVASTTIHRVQKFLDCAYKYDYEPYAKKHTGMSLFCN